jgi:hypothetical protein
MSAVGFEPTILAGERPQTYDLDHSATGTEDLTLIFKIPMAMRKNFFKIYRQFGYGPSKRLASPGLMHQATSLIFKKFVIICTAGHIMLGLKSVKIIA